MMQAINFMGKTNVTAPAKKAVNTVVDKTHEYLGEGAILETTEKVVDISKQLLEEQAKDLNLAYRAAHAPHTLPKNPVDVEMEEAAKAYKISHSSVG